MFHSRKNVHCSSMKNDLFFGWKRPVNYSTAPFSIPRTLFSTQTPLGDKVNLAPRFPRRLLSSDSWPEREGLDATSFEQLPFHRAHDEKENERQTLLYTRLNSFNRARGASWSSESPRLQTVKRVMAILRIFESSQKRDEKFIIVFELLRKIL